MEFEAVFVADSGDERRVPWSQLPALVEELGRPARPFSWHRGRRSYPGWYWSATLGRQVGFESWLERDHLVALDFDASVVGIVSQPFWLLWTPERGKPRRHAPDFLVRSADGRRALSRFKDFAGVWGCLQVDRCDPCWV